MRVALTHVEPCTSPPTHTRHRYPVPLEAEFMLADTLEHLRPDTQRFASFQQAQAAALKLEAAEEQEALKAAVLLAKSRVGAWVAVGTANRASAWQRRVAAPCVLHTQLPRAVVLGRTSC